MFSLSQDKTVRLRCFEVIGFFLGDDHPDRFLFQFCPKVRNFQLQAKVKPAGDWKAGVFSSTMEGSWGFPRAGFDTNPHRS
jgi:hypothetical protein